MTAFDVEAILADLKGFQRDAVEHVIDRFYRDDDTGDRFLIADETGLGKSVVARGVIARTIEHLQHEASVDRIDIVYICSNSDLATQNLRRLDVTGTKAVGFTSRLTLLAKSSGQLAAAPVIGGKKVNLVSFTPGTSFNMSGWRSGSAEERAMLHLMFERVAPGDAIDGRASALFFRATVRSESAFDWRVGRLRDELRHGLDPAIVTKFADETRTDGTMHEFVELREALRGLDDLPDEWDRHRQMHLIARLRTSLAKASVDTLEPDLIILDEFQRFRDLLDPETGGEAAELADSLFSYRTASGMPAKVLLLSATPYKPYTTTESDGDESHYEDFMATVQFLARKDRQAVERIRSALREYREALTEGAAAEEPALSARHALLPYMSRSERRQQTETGGLNVRWLPTATPTVDDIVSYARLQKLADEIDTPIPLDYWKSVPHFASFMEGYKPGQRTREQLAKRKVARALAALPGLDGDAIQRYDSIDVGNEHLRALASETIGRGWWKMLWVPASLPYLEPGPVYRSIEDADVTKRVIFSAWTSVPTAVASLLSYEAERLMVGDASFGRETELRNTAEARTSITARLNYVVREGRAASMANFALFWPHAALARACDPLDAARSGARTLDDAERWAQGRLGVRGSAAETAPNGWTALFSTRDGAPESLDAAALGNALLARGADDSGNAEGEDAESLGRAVPQHVALALETGAIRARSHPDLVRLAMHSPANIAWRALDRLRSADGESTDAGHWRAAASLANALRSLFNRMESMFLIDQVIGADKPYWSAVLDYCADGNLQAVLDEYVFQLRSEIGGGALTDDILDVIATRAAQALTLRPTRYTARDTSASLEPIPFAVRFALRYGGRLQDEESSRQPEIRNAFNSPFAPFVLASTSVGQEGIDFHWWSHSVVHWNLPSNPVDFEQREGRVNRFAGHAVRKNIAAAHGAAAIASHAPELWGEMFALATDAHPELGEFAPWWIYPGTARIERVLVSFPLSRDRAKYEQLRTDLTLYRLALGQPRQEDMLELLRRRGVTGEDAVALDLRPPAR